MNKTEVPRKILDFLSAHPAFEEVRQEITANPNGARPLYWYAEGTGRAIAAALIAHWLKAERLAEQKPVVMVTENLREQEELFNALVLWEPSAVFLPRLELATIEGALPDPEILAERLDVLRRVADGEVDFLVAAVDAFGDRLPSPARLGLRKLELVCGETISPAELAERLRSAGFERRDPVLDRGQFALRGGIMDIFAPDQRLPLRVEFFGDEIASMREFDPDSQRATKVVSRAVLLLDDFFSERNGDAVTLLENYFPPGTIVVATKAFQGIAARVVVSDRDPPEIVEGARQPPRIEMFSSGGRLPGELVHSEGARRVLTTQLMEWREDGWESWIFCANEGERGRLEELLGNASGLATFSLGPLQRGFLIAETKLAVLSDAELLGRYQVPSARRISAAERRSGVPVDLSTLEEGCLVVHLQHGIGRYLGLRETAPGAEEMVLEFAEGARLYVPLQQSYLVSRYAGIGRRHPPLSTLGSGRWAKTKETATRSVESFAAKLLAVQALRETRQGHAFSSDKPWQEAFERACPFRETPDQLRAIAETKRDMESPRPMDRLICGDVGFGKTEVAIRAAFKAVLDGKQVAMLVPTTVLAQQHYKTFRERMSEYPVRVAIVSRFSPSKEIRGTLEGLRDGSIDIVVGTHRLVSSDVEFKDLGLVIIDEEQRFGVRHKERLKARFELADHLTLSATPIPRTLYLSLVGARDMSTIETPPPNRYPVETVVCAYDERIIRDAVRRELERGGQVYFLHNRVATIEKVAHRLAELCPDARVAIGHGQMEDWKLEDVMRAFVAGETDVLVATTIIESGLDIPNANTIIIDRADRFGLADLYQLRGRVGRAQHKAYAYLLLPRDLVTTRGARKRVGAIRHYSSLGAGFRVAMRDLEIRGAGNILGTEQSGHVVAVGFDLYCSMLRRAVARLKGESVGPETEIPVRIDFVSLNEGEHEKRQRAGMPSLPAFLPAQYIPKPNDRMAAYRVLVETGTLVALEELTAAWRDRFGPLPSEVENLLTLARIRVMSALRGLDAIEVRDRRVMLSRRGELIMPGGKFPRLTSNNPAGSVLELLSLVEHL